MREDQHLEPFSKRFQRLIFLGNSSRKLEKLPTRDESTLVVMSDRRLPWLGHVMKSGLILVVLDELLAPPSEKTVDRRVSQIEELPGVAPVRLLFNAGSRVNPSLRAAILANAAIDSYSVKRPPTDPIAEPEPGRALDPMSDLSFLEAVVDDFAAQGASLHFCDFDAEFEAVEAEDPDALTQKLCAFIEKGYLISQNSPTFDLEGRVTGRHTSIEPGSASDTMVSLIIPLYNAEQFIKKTLQSIVQQRFESLEVVIINDGSTDRSPKLAQKFAKSFRKFTYLEQENQGVSAARNRGLSVASGKYIAFLDADDMLTPGSIARRVQFLDSSGFRVCGGLTEIIGDDDRSLNLRLGRHGHCTYEDLWEVMHHISTIMGQSELMKSRRFPVGQAYAEDWRYTLDLASEGDRIGFCGEEPLSKYRWHGVSAVGKEVLDHFETCIDLMASLPIKPNEELGISMAMGGSIGVNGAKLRESAVMRTQNVCLTLAIAEGSQSLDQRIVNRMNAIDEKFADPIPDVRFENAFTRALLLPRNSSELHHRILERAPDALETLKVLARTPANEALVHSFREYLEGLKSASKQGNRKSSRRSPLWFRRRQQ